MENKNQIKTSYMFVITAIVIIASFWLYNYSALKTECKKQVQHNSGALEKIYGSFSWNSKSFESRDEAIKGCLREIKELKQRNVIEKTCREYATKETIKEKLVLDKRYLELTEEQKVEFMLGFEERYDESTETERGLAQSTDKYKIFYASCLTK